MNAPTPSRWDELFDLANSIIDQANAEALIIDRWTFGGGTALMLQIGHRESHDIDIFLTDPQLLPYLNPQTQDFVLNVHPSDYFSDGARSLKVAFEGIGEIDFICAPSLTDTVAIQTDIRGKRVMLETPSEIVAKKIVYRGSMIQPRDIFDIAASCRHLGDKAMIKDLSEHKNACQQALQVTRGMDPRFAQSVMSNLMIRSDFNELTDRAQDITTHFLEKACKDQ